MPPSIRRKRKVTHSKLSYLSMKFLPTAKFRRSNPTTISNVKLEPFCGVVGVHRGTHHITNPDGNGTMVPVNLGSPTTRVRHNRETSSGAIINSTGHGQITQMQPQRRKERGDQKRKPIKFSSPPTSALSAARVYSRAVNLNYGSAKGVSQRRGGSKRGRFPICPFVPLAMGRRL